MRSTPSLRHRSPLGTPPAARYTPPVAKSTCILGLSCYYHDSAAALIKDGDIVFAAQEERYTRKKHDDSLPKNAVAHALAHAGITMDDVSAVGFYEKPLLKFFDRILPTYIKVWPRGFRQCHGAMREWMEKKLWIPQNIKKELQYEGPVFCCSHHESHAASAYFVSGFDSAAIVTVDGVGEWATTTIGRGKGTDLQLLKEIHFPHSLGLLYSAITYYLGFKVNSAEYKVMGLAPYGEPNYLDQMRRLIDVNDDGSFTVNMDYFCYEYGLAMTGKKIEELFGQPTRKPESPLTQFHKDVARSLQEITDDAMLTIVKQAKKICPSENLCLAGGVALNCVSNGKILKSGLFENIFIQPAAGDAGGSLGVALLLWHRQFHGAKVPKMEHAFLGNSYANEEIEEAIRGQNLPFERLDDAALIDTVATLLQGDNIIGWFQGRMEFGPRSLGNRSILADARNKENWQKVNLKIKFRESFRPFAPTVLEERTSDYFDLHRESPYMLIVADTLPSRRSEIPAVTHVDGSARIQTIRRDQNPKYYDLIKTFEEKTGCPVLINTSFNVRGEPIVESPKDALNCFLHTQMDCLAMGNYLLSKKDIANASAQRQEEYLKKFALD
ncbi:carbamoyltransferase [Candidatus Peregrinibacteria bacterium]|nr:carbamoyltransferase [Candidatus Peregrinibacteria bacterium]MBI3816617.1 carbamoyltransferase [Candidatus Peregrinibacteria bacterium]